MTLTLYCLDCGFRVSLTLADSDRSEAIARTLSCGHCGGRRWAAGQLKVPEPVAASLGSEAGLLLRLAIAAVLAAALGWEREHAGKPAGLRTHMLVGLAASLYTVLATLSISEYAALGPGARGDPGRIIQAVALGIGFLGGGVISAGRSEGRVHLTTAASIWATAAVGIAVGLGYYALATGATALQLIILHGVARLEPPRGDSGSS